MEVDVLEEAIRWSIKTLDNYIYNLESAIENHKSALNPYARTGYSRHPDQIEYRRKQMEIAEEKLKVLVDFREAFTEHLEVIKIEDSDTNTHDASAPNLDSRRNWF
jgi:hypothetical protein